VYEDVVLWDVAPCNLVGVIDVPVAVMVVVEAIGTSETSDLCEPAGRNITEDSHLPATFFSAVRSAAVCFRDCCEMLNLSMETMRSDEAVRSVCVQKATQNMAKPL
jgi:hypothetical protein